MTMLAHHSTDLPGATQCVRGIAEMFRVSPLAAQKALADAGALLCVVQSPLAP